MSANHCFYPQILLSEDLRILQATVRALTDDDTGAHRNGNREKVAKIVLRLYRSGMTEPRKLADLAALMARQAASSHRRPGL
ncbi:MAG: hypothetical protein ACK4N1_05155 [Pseudorhizobium sp.]